MHAPLGALVLLSVLASEPAGRRVTLALPHALREGETALLLVTVGVIPRGAEIEITTPSGGLVGVISPYGIRPGREAGTYTVPLPSRAISGRRVTLHVSLRSNRTQRAPTKKEVRRLRVVIRSYRSDSRPWKNTGARPATLASRACCAAAAPAWPVPEPSALEGGGVRSEDE